MTVSNKRLVELNIIIFESSRSKGGLRETRESGGK